jgi:hypothetical protein
MLNNHFIPTHHQQSTDDPSPTHFFSIVYFYRYDFSSTNKKGGDQMHEAGATICTVR